MPGAYGRTTVTLTLEGEIATLEAHTERPPQEERQHFNVSAWQPVAGEPRRLTGSVKRRPERFTATFAAEPGGTLTLTCVDSVERVHEAGATVTPPSCSPCYDKCTELPSWVPATTHTRRGWACRVKKQAASEDSAPPDFPPLQERAFFSPPPGVEFVTGKTDCPPQGFREPGAPAPDWSAFPEGTSALRDVRASLKKKSNPPPVVTSVARRGTSVEVTHEGVRYTSPALRGAARSDDGQHTLGLSCWREARTVHSEDLRFKLAPGPHGGECEGQDDLPRSRGARQQSLLVCRPVFDGAARDDVLVFVPGGIVERLDLDADCSRRRALRQLKSVDAPGFGAEPP